MSKYLLIFDADNTIWDTNAVFESAQLALLNVLSNANLLKDPQLHLKTLRTVDKELFTRLGKFEYNFKLLATTLTYYYLYNLPLNDAIDCSVSQESSQIYESNQAKIIIENAYNALIESLEEIPELYPDTNLMFSSLDKLKSSNCLTTILLTEGNSSRISQILEVRDSVRNFFDEILIVNRKSKIEFERAKRIGLNLLSNKKTKYEYQVLMSIGDSLKRDIKFGNQVGLTTVYKPSYFMGMEKPSEKDETPSFEISSLKELPPLLDQLVSIR